MQSAQVPPGFDRNGWVYEECEFTDTLLENIEKLSLPCAESHPARLRNCTQTGKNDETLRLCTFYERDNGWGDDMIQCLHCTSLGSEGICQRHIDIVKYQELIGTATFNQFQRFALDAYNGGHFAYISSDPELASSGDGLIKCIVQELADAEDCDSWNETLRRIGKMESQIAEISKLAEVHHAFIKNGAPQ